MKSLLSLVTSVTTVAANCACGYTVNKTESNHYALFTDLLETDFLHIQDVTFNSSYDIGWIPQDYNTTKVQDNGPYGMARESRNVVPNYIDNQYNWLGPGIKSVDPGLQLWVRSTLIGKKGHQMVPSAEIVSQRNDILYGSFRIAMKTTDINGTCSAFFFYCNDSQEVDLEILSAEQHSEESNWPIHLVVQNTSNTIQPNYNESSQMIYQMAFPPGGTPANYNEYRFDWLPGRISYYVNGYHAWTTTENIPSTPGRIHFSHWSNGNPLWSQGPPIQDAALTVSYVKAYFNSTNSTRVKQYSDICPAGKADVLKQTCEIPTQYDPPNPVGSNGNYTGHTFFFTHHHNMTPNEIVYDNPLNSPSNRRAEPPGLFSAIHIYWKRITQFGTLILDYLNTTTWFPIVIRILKVFFGFLLNCWKRITQLDTLILNYLKTTTWFPIVIRMLRLHFDPFLNYLKTTTWFPLAIWMLTVFLGP